MLSESLSPSKRPIYSFLSSLLYLSNKDNVYKLKCGYILYLILCRRWMDLSREHQLQEQRSSSKRSQQLSQLRTVRSFYGQEPG